MAFPTETVYGLGADAFNAARGGAGLRGEGPALLRPAHRPPRGRRRAGAASSATDDPRVAVLAARFWPGPLTLVLPRRPEVPDLVTSGLDTVGVRVPAHPAARALLAAAGTPVAAPSANPFGYVSPTTAAHVAELLGPAVDLVLDGGPCRVGVESTILSLAGDAAGRSCDRAASRGRPSRRRWACRSPLAGRGERPLAPGQLPRHYATRTPLTILAGEAGPPPEGRGGAPRLAPGGRRATPRSRSSPPTARPETAAANLFAALRRLDAAGLDLILAEPCAETGLGHAIMDRLRRAAEPAEVSGASRSAPPR